MLVITKPAYGNPGALVEVLRETHKRVYVRVVETGGTSMPSRVRGYYAGGLTKKEQTPYVEMDDLFAQDVTPEQYAQYVEAYRKRQADYQAGVAEVKLRTDKDFEDALLAIGL